MRSLSPAKKVVCLFLLVFTLVFSSAQISFAQNLYGIAQHFTSSIHGTYFYATIQNMNSNWSSTNNTRFILHTTWIASGTRWIENGFMDGAIQEPGGTIEYHRGYYTATGDLNNSSAYREYKIIGPSTNVGTSHAFHIQRDGTNSWGVYVDFTLRRTYSGFATSANRTDVGLETNTTASTSAQWNERAFQTYSGTAWNDWTSGDISRSTGISASWDTEPISIFTSKP